MRIFRQGGPCDYGRPVEARDSSRASAQRRSRSARRDRRNMENSAASLLPKIIGAFGDRQRTDLDIPQTRSQDADQRSELMVTFGNESCPADGPNSCGAMLFASVL